MDFKSPLIEGVLIKRYKRFLADIKLGKTGELITAHVPNSGSMLGVKDPGSLVRVSLSDNPNRKLKHTLEMIKPMEGVWVGVNTSITNHLVREAFENKLIPSWKKFESIQAEVKINEHTRLDFLLTKGKQKHYVEVKNVSMSEPPWAVFPDAVTERGQKHLQELMKLVKKGHGAELLFVVQREDCNKFKPADNIDPEYGWLLRKASKNGVIINCRICKMKNQSIEISQEIPVLL